MGSGRERSAEISRLSAHQSADARAFAALHGGQTSVRAKRPFGEPVGSASSGLASVAEPPRNVFSRPSTSAANQGLVEYKWTLSDLVPFWLSLIVSATLSAAAVNKLKKAGQIVNLANGLQELKSEREGQKTLAVFLGLHLLTNRQSHCVSCRIQSRRQARRMPDPARIK
jgi:hypothetical protein